jgi:hypothetical protein
MRHAIVFLALTLGAVAAEPQAIRFAPYSGELAYGLTVVPPWQDGGKLVISFPEHLEAGESGDINILRYYTKEPRGRWQVSPDGQTAVLDVESPATPGVWIKASGKVAGPERIEFVFAITNKTARPLVTINPLYCHQYASLTGFPQRAGQPRQPFPNFEHVYALTQGRVIRMSAVSTRDPQSRVRGANVVGCPQPENPFAENHGGRLPSPVDAAISAVTSLDGSRKLILAWTPGKSFLSNAEIPCIHADPYYGTIQPGKSAQARGVLILTEKPLEPEMLRLLKRGEGKAPGRSGKAPLRP